MRAASLLRLALFLLVVLGGGFLIGTSNPPGEWYAGLAKPGFTPPDWLFPVAWTLLYILVAFAGWRVFEAGPARARSIFVLQLALNFLWSPVFFGWQQIGLGFAVILALLAAILAFIAATWTANRPAAVLVLPYAVWVAYAGALNGAILWLN